MKKYSGRLAAAAVALTLVSTCLLGGTMARYTTTVEGKGTATVADWQFKVNEETENFTVALEDGSGTTADGKLVPGSEGSFEIRIDGTGSEVAIDYEAVFSNIKNKPANLKFYSDSAYATEIADLSAYQDVKGTIEADAADKKATHTIYWKWPYNDSTADTVPTEKSMTFDIAVTGTQQNPNPPAP